MANVPTKYQGPPWVNLQLHAGLTNLFEGLRAKSFLPLWRTFLPFYKRFIDDVSAAWLPPANLTHDEVEESWKDFKAEVNNSHGLEWEVSERK